MEQHPSHWPKGWDGDLELELLTSILERRAPHLQDLAEAIRLRRLTPSQREQLRIVVSDEMLEGGGLSEGWELNAYGDRLDLLIEWLGRVSDWDD